MAIVYVAGSSGDLERARTIMDLVRATPSLSLAHDWIAEFQAEPVSDDRLSRRDAVKYAAGDLSHVVRADVVWLLAPAKPTRGAWVEFGYALGLYGGLPSKLIVVSGEYTQSIFCALAMEFADDDAAFDAIVAWEGRRPQAVQRGNV